MRKPVVLDFAGLDPSGGAGLQADIETIFQLGGHALPILTAQTIQNTRSFMQWQAVEAGWLKNQVQHITNDIPPQAIKMGLITDTDVIIAISESLQNFLPRPLVIDPVFKSGSGTDLTSQKLIEAYRDYLLPHCDVITPNRYEARLLSGHQDLDRAAQQLIQWGCKFVLITGADEAHSTHDDCDVINDLYGSSGRIQRYRCEKLAGTFHGSGCTLSAAIAVLLAHGLAPKGAIEQALKFTWLSLKEGQQLGYDQAHPNRKVEISHE